MSAAAHPAILRRLRMPLRHDQPEEPPPLILTDPREAEDAISALLYGERTSRVEIIAPEPERATDRERRQGRM